MERLEQRSSENRASQVYFKISLDEIITKETNNCIKSILNTLDYNDLEPNNKEDIRKVVLDSVNDFGRTVSNLLTTLVEDDKPESKNK